MSRLLYLTSTTLYNVENLKQRDVMNQDLD